MVPSASPAPHALAPSAALAHAVERQVLARDGLLVPVGSRCLLEADLASSARHRASALAAAVPSHTVAIAETAAWVHAGGELTWPLHLGVSHRQRAPSRLGHYRGRCLPIPDDRVTRLAGLRVLVAPWAAVEVARFVAVERATELLVLLAERCALEKAEILALISSEPGRPGTRRARELVSAALPARPLAAAS